jgi:hypothetical protein
VSGTPCWVRNVELFGARVVVELLRTHPKVVVGGRVVDIPYYLTADEYLATPT